MKYSHDRRRASEQLEASIFRRENPSWRRKIDTEIDDDDEDEDGSLGGLGFEKEGRRCGVLRVVKLIWT